MGKERRMETGKRGLNERLFKEEKMLGIDFGACHNLRNRGESGKKDRGGKLQGN